MKDIAKDQAQVKVNGELPILNMNMNKPMYSNLLKMGECFALPAEFNNN